MTLRPFAALFLGALLCATTATAQPPPDAVDHLLNAHHVDAAWLVAWEPTPDDVEALLRALDEDSILRHRKRAAAALALAPLDDSRVEVRLRSFVAFGKAKVLKATDVPAALTRQAASTLLLRAQRRGRLQHAARQLVKEGNAIVREEVVRVAGESAAVPVAEVLGWAKGSKRLTTIAQRAIARRRHRVQKATP